MNERELRELDIQVHEALYPNVTLAVRGWGDIPTHWLDVGRMVEIPRYTTDIGAWEPVYALKPEWWWDQDEHRDGAGGRYVAVTMRALVVPWWSFEVCVYGRESTGLAAYALGRARCVIAWAEGRGEG